MSSTGADLLAEYDAALRAMQTISRDIGEYHALADAELLQIARLSSDGQRVANIDAAIIAAEIARRSTREAGHDGLAQRKGFRTPEELLRATTGTTAREATSAIRAGRLAHDSAEIADAATGEVAPALQPWLAAVGRLLAGGQLSVAHADSIRNGLGEPTELISSDALASAADELCELARELDADKLFRRARELRDELDSEGVREREARRRDERSLWFTQRPDGMGKLVWTMDPETAAQVAELFDRTTSPRRGGPRFTSGPTAELAGRITEDDRTLPQLASDVFLQLLRQGADADDSELLGTGAPVLRILVAQHTMETRSGSGHIEGQTDAVSIETAERVACAGTTATMTFGAQGLPLDLGREQRLFNRRQRVVLAARWGGCAWPGCDRPPAWTEAHHVDHWQRDAGQTNIADGILLCRFHHLLLHNNHWEISRDGPTYRLVPPPEVDSTRTPIELTGRSPAFKEVMEASRT